MDNTAQYNSISYAGCTNGKHISIQTNPLTHHCKKSNLYHRMVEKENAIRENPERRCRMWKMVKMEMEKVKGWLKKKNLEKEEMRAATTLAHTSLHTPLALLTAGNSSTAHLSRCPSQRSLTSSNSPTGYLDTHKPLPRLPTYRESEKAVRVEIVDLGDVEDPGDVVVGLGDKRRRVEIVWGVGVGGNGVAGEAGF